jgi:molybdopterin-guanine dinucleotide biosynthesis protein A
MGRAKAWLPWFGKTMIEHVVDCLRPVVQEIIVVTSSELDLPRLDAKLVIDSEIAGGPLVGIREGLKAASSDMAFVTSVDAPHLRADFVKGLFAIGGAAAPLAEEHVQVLSAVYPCDAWRKADELLAGNVRRPLHLLEALEYKPIECASSQQGSPWQGFNTPTEYLEAVRDRDPDARAVIEFLGRSAKVLGSSSFNVPVNSIHDILAGLPGAGELLESQRLRPSHLICLGGRDLVRDLFVPVGPGERVSVIDALAGG